MSFKTLFPTNTIVGKWARGDKEGAKASAVNYVKSGEISRDIANVTRLVASGGADVGAWANMGKKAYGDDIKKILNPNQSSLPNQQLKPSEGIESFSATTGQLANIKIAEEKKNMALASGAGIFSSKPLDSWEKIPLGADRGLQFVGSGISYESKTNIDTTTLVALGVGAFLLLK